MKEKHVKVKKHNSFHSHLRGSSKRWGIRDNVYLRLEKHQLLWRLSLRGNQDSETLRNSDITQKITEFM